jgi:hypothetical protein
MSIDNYKVMVMVKFSVDGMHNFPAAKELFEEVGFLSDRHRHMFHFTAACTVTHSDRDKEFIMLKRDMLDYMFNEYYDDMTRTHEFGAMSCEMLAQELLEQFDCEWVECWEDNENGARVQCV